MDNWSNHIAKQYAKLSTIRVRLSKIQGNARHLVTKTQQILNFVNNDYLGLSTNPKVINALINTSKIYGVGSSGAPTLGGYSEEHQLLAEELAQWLKCEKCLLFSSGYQLNIGIFSQLVNSDTIVWLDKRCHSSHIDGIMLARAKFITFDENSVDKIISEIGTRPNYRHLILSEGSFSMDGTCYYWKKLIQLKLSNPKNIMLIIDDAHGIGALGINGHGTLEQIGADIQHVDMIIGTLGKAFGTHGGFICGNAKLINYLQQSVRSQIFSTNLPPAIAAASRASLAIINSFEGLLLRRRLVNNINYFQQLAIETGLELTNDQVNRSPIKLIVYNDEQVVRNIHSYLFKHNILIGQIFYPTVPKAKPRLRISLNTQHEKSDLKALANCLAESRKIL